MSVNEPSQHEANNLIRVLSNKPLKFTVRIFLPDGRAVEYQSDNKASILWLDAARTLWIFSAGYDGTPICEYVPGSVILCEENPK